MKVLSAPFHVCFVLTNACNQRCPHCCGVFGQKGQNEMTTEEIKEVVEQLYDVGVYDIELSGGEPSLRPDILEIMDYVSRYEINVTMPTNGVLWTESMIKKIGKTWRGKWINISIDGYDPQTYAVTRGRPEDFWRVLQTTKLMKEEGIGVIWNFVYSDLTRDFLDNLLRLAIEKQVEAVYILPIVSVGKASKSENIIRMEELKYLLVDLPKAYAEHLEIRIAMPTSLDYIIPLALAGYNQNEIIRVAARRPHSQSFFSRITELDCLGAINTVNISQNGDITICDMFVNVSEFVAGNLFKQNFGDIWANSSLFNWKRSIRLQDIKAPCSKCKWRSLCGGGCRARAYFLTGDFLGPDPLCPFTNYALAETRRVERTPISGPQLESRRIVQWPQRQNLFTVFAGGLKISVRKEDFGAYLIHPNGHILVNKAAYDVLKLLLDSRNNEDEVIERLSKLGFEKEEAEKKVKGFFDYLVSFKSDDPERIAYQEKA
jgi:radical SAM protein with 4Fe4S-binding SPASM domain